MRWSYNDIMNGSKNGITFDHALHHKSIIKMDIVCFFNNRFIEITEVYNNEELM